MKTKEIVIAVIFIILSLVVYSFFSSKDIFQQVITTLFFFLLLPIFFNNIILKKKIKSAIFNMGDYKQGLMWGGYSLIVVSIIFFVISYYFDFLNYYTVPVFIVNNFLNFLFYEFIMVMPIIFLYEFYFRGFVMPIFNRFGYWSILIQMSIFFALVFSDNTASIVQFIPYLIFAPFAGLIAYKSKSIVYSGIIQFSIIILLNVIIIAKIG